MVEKLAFTVRLEGRARELYEEYKKKLEEKVPKASHTQTISSLIIEALTS